MNGSYFEGEQYGPCTECGAPNAPLISEVVRPVANVRTFSCGEHARATRTGQLRRSQRHESTTSSGLVLGPGSGAAIRQHGTEHLSDDPQDKAVLSEWSAETVGFVVWLAHRVEEAATRDAIAKHPAVDGVPCALLHDQPVWGTLVLTSSAYVWEPGLRARNAGHPSVRLENRLRATTRFHDLSVGTQSLRAMTISTPDCPAYTVVMSASSSDRLRRLLSDDPEGMAAL